jgi:ferredoxin/flavodoxin---NADP+ reductase
MSLKDNKIDVKVLDVILLDESTFVLRLERNGFQFKAGQYLVLSVPGERKAREYSIYSSEYDPYIELLIKEVNPGDVSRELRCVKIGSILQISGPFGFFVLDDRALTERKPVIFVATGTGISPFHSIVTSNPSIDYRVIHGIRNGNETFGKTDFLQNTYISCTTRDVAGDFHGRVTNYLEQNDLNANALYYLCGNSAMVDQVIDLLETKGLPAENIKTEIFF